MKKLITFLSVLATVTGFSQISVMNIYKNDGTVTHIPVNTIDSITYTTANLAILTTDSVTSITNNSALCGGNISSDGGTPVTARGVVFGTSSNPTTSNNVASSASGAGSFSAYLSGLTPGATYYARAYATNASGTSYGNEVTFMTDTSSAGVTTIVIPDTVMSDVYYHQTSYLNSTRLSFPNLKRVTGYVYFHETNNIVEVDFPQLKSTGSYFYVNGNLSLQKVSAPNLDSVTDYVYVRLNSLLQILDICNLTGIYCSNQEPYYNISGNNATLDSLQPCFNATLYGTTLSTSPITNFSSNTAIAGGTITHSCGVDPNYGVCWSTSPNPTINNSTASGSGTPTFTANMTGLSPNTTYYVRAYYGNNVYGNEVSFTTLP